MVDNAILRKNAREQLGGNIFGSIWLTMLGVCAVPSLILGFAGMVRYVGWIASIILTGPLLYGIAKTTVKCVERDKWEFSGVFCGFTENFAKSLMLGFLQSLFIALWTLLFIIPGLVKSYSYAMAFYIQQDNKDKEPVDCITESRRMMDGYKWKLFCLDLSFIGWYIVGALCLGIGALFVTPYHEMARANFYEALKAELYPVSVIPMENTQNETETSEEENV